MLACDWLEAAVLEAWLSDGGVLSRLSGLVESLGRDEVVIFTRILSAHLKLGESALPLM